MQYPHPSLMLYVLFAIFTKINACIFYIPNEILQNGYKVIFCIEFDKKICM